MCGSTCARSSVCAVGDGPVMPQACKQHGMRQAREGSGRRSRAGERNSVTALRRVRCCGPAVMGLSVCAEDLHGRAKHKPAVVMLLQRHPGHNGGVSATAGVFIAATRLSAMSGDAARKAFTHLVRRDDDRQGPPARAYPCGHGYSGGSLPGGRRAGAGYVQRGADTSADISGSVRPGRGERRAVLRHPCPAVYPRIRRFPLAMSAGGSPVGCLTSRDTARRRTTCAGAQVLGPGPSLTGLIRNPVRPSGLREDSRAATRRTAYQGNQPDKPDRADGRRPSCHASSPGKLNSHRLFRSPVCSL